MEIRQISRLIEEGDRVLDVGCANGYSTAMLAAQKKAHMRGVDYIPEMIDRARDRLAELEEKLAGTLEFDVGDIMKLDDPSAAYDKVIVIRVLINLGSWENQFRAMRECLRVLKPNGLLIFSEATIQGWRKLNAFRREWKLADI